MKVFISYRAREHRDLVPRLANQLNSEGIDAVYDDIILPMRQILPRHSAALPYSSGVAFYMLQAVQSCDIVVQLLSSNNATTPSEMDSYRELADSFWHALHKSPEFGYLAGWLTPSFPDTPYTPLIYELQTLSILKNTPEKPGRNGRSESVSSWASVSFECASPAAPPPRSKYVSRPYL